MIATSGRYQWHRAPVLCVFTQLPVWPDARSVRGSDCMIHLEATQERV
jgi:hypothetical protein